MYSGFGSSMKAYVSSHDGVVEGPRIKLGLLPVDRPLDDRYVLRHLIRLDGQHLADQDPVRDSIDQSSRCDQGDRHRDKSLRS